MLLDCCILPEPFRCALCVCVGSVGFVLLCAAVSPANQLSARPMNDQRLPLSFSRLSSVGTSFKTSGSHEMGGSGADQQPPHTAMNSGEKAAHTNTQPQPPQQQQQQQKAGGLGKGGDSRAAVQSVGDKAKKEAQKIEKMAKDFKQTNFEQVRPKHTPHTDTLR